VLKNGTSSLGSPIVAKVMEFAHKEVYAADGRWKSGDWFSAPAGIQRVGNEVYPAWWNKTQGQANAKLMFDRVSKRKATECTPAGAKIELDVVKTTDPVTKKDAYSNVPDGYNANENDNAHACGDQPPSATMNTPVKAGNVVTFTGTISAGKFGANGLTATLKIGDITVCQLTAVGPYNCPYSLPAGTTGNQTATITVIDSGYYTGTASRTFSSTP